MFHNSVVTLKGLVVCAISSSFMKGKQVVGGVFTCRIIMLVCVETVKRQAVRFHVLGDKEKLLQF